MNTRMRIIVIFYGLLVALPTECMSLFKRTPKPKAKDSLTLPTPASRIKKPLVQTLKAVLLKKLPAPAETASIASPGLVASQTPTKTPGALAQVRREPSSRPPVLLQSLALPPLSPTSPDALSVPGPLTSSSSGRSGLSALSSPSSVSTASPLPSPSPDMESELGVAARLSRNVSALLHTSPAMAPISKRDSSPREFSPLPAAAITSASRHDDSPPSKHVHVGSFDGAETTPLPQAAGSIRDELEDEEEQLKPVIIQEDDWTDLMYAAWHGMLSKIKTMSFTGEDVVECHTFPGGEKENALSIAHKNFDKMTEQLENNPIWVSEKHGPDMMFEREVMKPIGSSDVGRPRWFAYYKKIRDFASEMDKQRPFWDSEQIEQALALNPNDTALRVWYETYRETVRNFNTAYETITDEDRSEYEQLVGWRAVFGSIIEIFNKKLVQQREKMSA